MKAVLFSSRPARNTWPGDQPPGSNPQPLYGQHAFARDLLPALGFFAQTCGSHASGTRSRLPVFGVTTARNCGDASDLNPTNSQDVSEPVDMSAIVPVQLEGVVGVGDGGEGLGGVGVGPEESPSAIKYEKKQASRSERLGRQTDRRTHMQADTELDESV